MSDHRRPRGWFTHRKVGLLVVLGVTASLPITSPALAVTPCSVPVVNGVFTVSTEAHLALIGTDTDCSAESFVLADDIALSASPWAPIADFEGAFDGNGHAITNLHLSGIDAGLFNVGTDGAVFSDLDITVANSTDAEDQVGALVGASFGSLDIDDVDVTGDVFGSSGSVGGLVGAVWGSNVEITNSSVIGDVTATGSYVGGVVGVVFGSSSVSVTSSGVTGNVTGEGHVGGVLGYVPIATVVVSSSPVVGNVTGTDFNVGGVIGMSATVTSVSVTSSGVSGNVTGHGYVGGLLGFAPNAAVTITSSPVVGNVTSTYNNLGGLIGMASSTQPVSVTGSGVTGDVTGTTLVGGLLGFVPNASVTIASSPVDGDVAGTADNVGGLLGFLGGTSPLTLLDASYSGNVTGDDYVGGLVGFVPNAPFTVASASVRGNVTASGDNSGGLVGFAATSGSVSVSDSSVVGDTSGSQYVGGLFGFVPNASVTVESTTVRGDVTGVFDPTVTFSGNNVGGLVGFSAGNGTISVWDSSVVGNTMGSSYVGGLLGFVPQGEIDVRRTSVSGDVTGIFDPNIPLSGSQVGGLIGGGSTADPIAISTSFVDGNVSGGEKVGGLVGFAPVAAATISRSFVRGTVVGAGDTVGGLIAGGFGDVDVDSSFVRATVTGNDDVGGLLGWVSGDITVNDSYFEGSVNATGADRGSVWGQAPLNPAVLDATFCTDVLCPQANTITTGELKSATFLEGRGWDVTNVWCVRSDLNDGFPVLRDIVTGSLDATRCRPVTVAIWRVELDPAGGTCTDGANTFSNKRVSVFVGYRYLPSSADCRREGHDFVGWADVAEPSTALKLPLLVDPSDGKKRLFLAAHGDLIAVWKRSVAELDDLSGTAPGTFVGGPDRPTREGGGVVDGFYIPPNTKFWSWMLAR